MSAHSAGTYTATLLVMVNVMKGSVRLDVHPPPLPAWANFTFMMECTPESSRCYTVYSVVQTLVISQQCPALITPLLSGTGLSSLDYPQDHQGGGAVGEDHQWGGGGCGT